MNVKIKKVIFIMEYMIDMSIRCLMRKGQSADVSTIRLRNLRMVQERCELIQKNLEMLKHRES